MTVRYTGRSRSSASSLHLVGECGGGRALVERLDKNGQPRQFAVKATNLRIEPDLFEPAEVFEWTKRTLREIRSVKK